MFALLMHYLPLFTKGVRDSLFRDWSKVDRVVVEESAAGLY